MRDRNTQTRALRKPMAGVLVTANCAQLLAASIARTIALVLTVMAASAQADDRDMPVDQHLLAIRAGKLITMDSTDTVINNAIVLLRDGKIERIGPWSEVPIPDAYRVIDASDKWVVPGMVETHNHSGAPRSDWNDMVYLTNPGLRTLETITPGNKRMKRARAGGVTSLLQIPGSGTNISGFGTVLKTAGKTVDEVVMRSPGSLKVSQAGNPEWYWYGVRRSYMNYNTRQTIQKARAYHEAWTAFERGESNTQPAFDVLWDEFRGVFEHKYPTLVHTQMYQVVMMTLDMIAGDMNLTTVLGHSTFDGFKLAPLAAKAGVYTSNGPRQFWFDRTQRKMHGNAARWWQGGIHNLTVNTDASVVRQEQLPFQAAIACWYGWKPYPALRGLTRIGAEALMIDDEVGSIEPGKDADLGIWTGDPLDPRSSCELTVIDGKIVYDASVKRRF